MIEEQLRAQFESLNRPHERERNGIGCYLNPTVHERWVGFQYCAKIKDAEIEKLKLALKYQDDREGHIGTHSPECYKFGYRHYECALHEIESLKTCLKQCENTDLELKAQVEKMRDALILIADPNADISKYQGDGIPSYTARVYEDIANEALKSTPESSLAEHDKEVEIKALEDASKHFYDHIDYSDVANSDDLNDKLKFASDHCQRLADDRRK